MEGLPKFENGESSIETARSIIRKAESIIQNEWEKGVNQSWFACVRTPATAAQLELQMAAADNMIEQEKADRILDKLNGITGRSLELEQQYPKGEVPAEVKADILASFKNIEHLFEE